MTQEHAELLEELASGEAPEGAKEELRAHPHQPTGRRLHHPLEGFGIERVKEAARRIEEVERVRRRRGVEDDQVPISRLATRAAARSPRALGAREARAEVVIEAILEDSAARRASRA